MEIRNMFEDLINKVTGGLDGIVHELLKVAQDKIKIVYPTFFTAYW
jgi:hypothetical protein